jgi:hypothetical protein
MTGLMAGTYVYFGRSIGLGEKVSGARIVESSRAA